MKFTTAPANPFYDDYDYTERLESENGRWTITLYPVIYGVRVQAGLTNDSWFALDVCCGSHEANIVLVYLTVKCWLESFPEDVDVMFIHQKFPKFKFKPITDNSEWEEFMTTVFKIKSPGVPHPRGRKKY